MSRILILLLVLTFSGFPAAAVVCDLMLCAGERPAAETGCHDHGTTSTDTQLTSRGAGCAHFTAVDPYLAPQYRLAVQLETSTIPSVSSHDLSAGLSVDRTHDHGPPRIPRVKPSLPLRI